MRPSDEMKKSVEQENMTGGERRIDLGPYRGMIEAGYDDPALLQAISRPEELWDRPGIEILNDKRNRVCTLRLPLSSGRTADIVVKEFLSRGVNKLKSIFLPSKAAKAWRGAQALKKSGLDTAAPIAYLERRKRGFLERCFFLAERVEGASEIRPLLRSLPPGEMKPLLSSLGRHLSLCHERGILHRDLSDGNILVKKDSAGQVHFYLLDTNRVRLRPKIGQLLRLKNLTRLGVPASFQHFFLEAYFRPQPLEKKDWLWYKMNKSVFTGYIALKKKLRLRQLARRLRIQ
jgi:serine/threonine protein kinase